MDSHESAKNCSAFDLNIIFRFQQSPIIQLCPRPPVNLLVGTSGQQRTLAVTANFLTELISADNGGRWRTIAKYFEVTKSFLSLSTYFQGAISAIVRRGISIIVFVRGGFPPLSAMIRRCLQMFADFNIYHGPSIEHL